MQKVSFNNAGLQQLLQAYYLQSDEELKQQALLIETDLIQWLINHFIFSESQLEDLLAMDETFMEEFSLEFAFFFENRLPVSLLKEETTALRESEPGRGKLYRNEKVSAQTYNPTLGLSTTETLNFSIQYLS
ncbi:hypothetical protein [Pedobacter glucosidilyticus]|uniref:hypothetical protein n=1 Tax=Pedobacter glucosidilyticus TaxID=1122941 RepID=UPI0026ED89FD|nr:hypothetical protein [Pedobacter glucosidilyticus]